MSIVEKQKLVGFISGSATTAYEILNATGDGRLPKTQLMGLVLSTPEAGGAFKANQLSLPPVPIKVVDPREFKTSEEYGLALIKAMAPWQPDIVGQFGHLPHTPKVVIDRYQGRMINQHPGPLDPSEYDFGGKGMMGKRVHLARLIFVRETRRNLWTDMTSQRVGLKFDEGKVLKRARVEILPTDTVDDLQYRALPVEWQVQIETLKDFENGHVRELPSYKDMGEDLILPGERLLLGTIKRLVCHAYPNV